MKTPQQYIASLPKCFDHCVTRSIFNVDEKEMEIFISIIQTEAFQSGWKKGLADAKEINALGPNCLEIAVSRS